MPSIPPSIVVPRRCDCLSPWHVLEASAWHASAISALLQRTDAWLPQLRAPKLGRVGDIGVGSVPPQRSDIQISLLSGCSRMLLTYLSLLAELVRFLLVDKSAAACSTGSGSPPFSKRRT